MVFPRFSGHPEKHYLADPLNREVSKWQHGNPTLRSPGREAVRLAEERGNRSAVTRELDIHPSMIRRWKE